MITSSYSDQEKYIVQVEEHVEPEQVTPYDNIKRWPAKELLNPDASQSLQTEYPESYSYDKSRIGYGYNSVPENGWVEKKYRDDSSAGGVVRTVILSGSYAELRKLRVDSEINSETVSTSWSASIGENLRVGNNAAVAGYVQLGNTESLSTSDIKGVDPRPGFAPNTEKISDLRLVVSNSALVQDRLYVGKDTSVSGNLDVKGNVKVLSDLTVEGDSETLGNSTVQKNLEVGGDIHGKSNLDIGKDANIDGNLTVVKNITGKENLYLTKDAHISGNLSVSKDVDISNNLTVVGNSYFTGSSQFKDNVSISGSTNIQKDLFVSGNAEIKKNAIVVGGLTVSESANIVKNLYVTGNATVKSDLIVEGTASFLGDTNYAGDAHFKKNVTIDGNLNVKGTATIIDTEELTVKDKSITLARSASTAAAADGAGIDIAGAKVTFHYTSSTDRMGLNKGLDIYGDENVYGNLNIKNDVSISGDTNITGKVDIKSDHLAVSGASFDKGNLKVDNAVSAKLISSSNQIITKYLLVDNSASLQKAIITQSYVQNEVVTSSAVITQSVVNSTVQTQKVTNQTVTNSNISTLKVEKGITLTTGSINAEKSDLIIHSVSGSGDLVMNTVSASYFYGDGSGLQNVTSSLDPSKVVVSTADFSNADATSIYRFTHDLGSENLLVAVYQYADIKDGHGTTNPVLIVPEQVSIPNTSSVDIVFGRAIDRGYVVISKAGHVLSPANFTEWIKWVDEKNVHYGTEGNWQAQSFTSETASANVVSAVKYIDTPKIGTLHTGEQYYYERDWGSYTEYTDQMINQYVRYDGTQESGIWQVSSINGEGDLTIRGKLITNGSFSTSDINRKNVIGPVENALEGVKSLDGVRFCWKDSGEQSIGVIAQNVKAIYPELTKLVKDLEGNNLMTVNYEGLIGVLIQAIKELSTKVERLESKLNNENR